MRRLRSRRKVNTATPLIVANISIDTMIMPASAPVDSVIDFEDVESVLDGDCAARVAVGRAVVVAVAALINVGLDTGSGATLAVHDNADPAAL
jgi:hypothetical protein